MGAAAIPLASKAITAAGTLGGASAQATAAENAANKQLEATKYGADVAAKTASEQLGFAKETEAAREAAYKNLLGTGTANQVAGESALTAEANTPNAMLEQEGKDIENKTARELQEASGQMRANLASEGVRGSQAATLLNRSMGTMGETAQMDINKLKAEDERQRQADLRAYMTLKAGRGQGAAQTGVTI